MTKSPSKREVRKEAIRRQYIEAAKSVILSEGSAAVTARRLGDLTGYSYATLYNYFDDIRHLLWRAMMALIDEMIGTLRESFVGKERFTLADVQEVYRVYVGYLLENPNMFRLVFIDPLGEPPAGMRKGMGEPILALHLLGGLNDPEHCRVVAPEELPALAGTITAAVHGFLLIHLSGKLDAGREAVLDKTADMLDCLLGKKT